MLKLYLIKNYDDHNKIHFLLREYDFKSILNNIFHQMNQNKCCDY